MKPLLYAGALLMVSASIYGFVDYKKSSRDIRFKTLYQETKAEEPPLPVTEKKATPEIAAKEEEKQILKSEQVNNERRVKQKRPKKLNAKIYSRAALESYEPVQIEEPPVTIEVKAEK